MNFLPPILRSSLAYFLLCGVLATAIISCDKESNTDALRRKYPIPTELPEASCEGANTVGARFDSILFAANYFPNTSSWGSPTPEDGVRAFIETASDGSIEYIQVLGKHPIRPHEIDNRSMNFHLRYFHTSDSLRSFKLIYSGARDFTLHILDVPKPYTSALTFDPQDSIFCGVIPILKIPESNPEDFGDLDTIDTIVMRDFRIDVPVQMGRY